MEEVDKEDRNQNPNQEKVKGYKGKSCKGCLYYSSVLKSKSQNPTCVGIPRTQQVPGYIVGKSELQASKEGHTITNNTNFKYACVGYSVYLDKKDSSIDQQDKQAVLPFCAVGIEMLRDERIAPADHVPAHGRRREDGQAFPQPRTYKPVHSEGAEYLNRLSRNASLVASGVARNMNRVGIYIKESLDDILYPYRRRPK